MTDDKPLTDEELRVAWGVLENMLRSWGATPEQCREILRLDDLNACAGGPTPPELREDLMKRAGFLIFFQRSLLTLYPKNPEIRATWMSTPEPGLHNLIPLDIMGHHGVEGLKRVHQRMVEWLSR